MQEVRKNHESTALGKVESGGCLCANCVDITSALVSERVALGKVPRSSLAEVHKEFVHHIVEDEVDGQK